MTENNFDNLIKEYHKREIRWTNNSLSQLSFLNNLILTLSVGFLSFSYKNTMVKYFNFTWYYINWSLTFLNVSLSLMVLSIILGLITSLNRLLDFRLTRKINQIRHRMIEHSQERLDESTPVEFNWITRFKLPFKLLRSVPNITIEECKNFKNISELERKDIKDNFRNLRNIAHNLGVNTWRNTLLQLCFFGLSILFYFIGQFR